MNILITGVTGFTGSHLAELLITKGADLNVRNNLGFTCTFQKIDCQAASFINLQNWRAIFRFLRL